MTYRANVNSSLKRLVLKEKRKAPYLGVRLLANLLKEKYKVSLSKSAIHKILKNKGIKEGKGRKSSLLVYKKREIENCGLILLRCIDFEVGIFEYLAQELRIYFPKIKIELLEKLITLLSFSSFLDMSLKESIKKSRGLLRLVDLYQLPHLKVNYFLKRLTDYKPVIGLVKLGENLKFVSTLKISFKNGYVSYLDAKLSTFWDGPCQLQYFYSPLKATKTRLAQMLEENVIMVAYTKSFDYISTSVVNFLGGLESGIERIGFLAEKNRLLEEQKFSSFKPYFFIGYYPKILAKGFVFLEEVKRFKGFSWEDIEKFYYTTVLTRFLQLKERKGFILNNVLISRKITSLPSWGILTNKRGDLTGLFERYLELWPYREKSFLEEIQLLEKSLVAQETGAKEQVILPEYIGLEKEEDFSKIAQFLGSFFKQRIGEYEVKKRVGRLILSKNLLKILLKEVPLEIKNSFNKTSLYLGKRRAFLL